MGYVQSRKQRTGVSFHCVLCFMLVTWSILRIFSSMAFCLGGLNKLVNTSWQFWSLGSLFNPRIQTEKEGFGVSFYLFILAVSGLCGYLVHAQKNSCHYSCLDGLDKLVKI